MNRIAKLGSLLLIFIFILSSCKNERSSTTGWEYNNPDNGGFEVYPFMEQITGPGLVLVDGGTFVFGRQEQDVMYEWNNVPRRITVSSFYMDETEISNLDYLNICIGYERVFVPADLKVYTIKTSDENVWRDN
jgi:formylglycine-generating enzyme required for sulfatase activity